MNEKILTQYERVILCSGEIPLVRHANALYLLKTENTLKVYPFAFAADKELIVLTTAQYQELQDIGMKFPSERKETASVNIEREQHPEVVEKIISICGFHAIENSLCSLQAFYNWGMKIGDEVRQLRRENKPDETKNLVDTVSGKFTKWYRELALAFHPDKANNEQVGLHTCLMQELTIVKNKIKSAWENDTLEDLAELAAELDRIEQSIDAFEERMNNDDELFSVFKQFIDELNSSVKKQQVNVNQEDTLKSEDTDVISSVDNDVKQPETLNFFNEGSGFLSLDELAGRSNKTRDEFVDELFKGWRDLTVCLKEIIEHHNKDKKVERLSAAWEEIKTETEAIIAKPETLSDSTIDRLIRQLKSLIESLQQMVAQLEARQQANQEENTSYFTATASKLAGKVTSLFNGINPFNFWEKPMQSHDNDQLTQIKNHQKTIV